MVAKGAVQEKTARATKTVKQTAFKKREPVKKIRIGVTVGKDWDPVKVGTHPPDFPKSLILTKDDWGKYSVDAVTAVRMRALHPDLIDVDIIPTKEFSRKRLQKNHVNLTFWPEPCGAMQISNKLAQEYLKTFKDPNSRLDPCWDYYDWIINKGKYMTSCRKANIPTIPTIIYNNGFDADQCLKDVQKKGWDEFFVKVGAYAMFGFGAINGKTVDFLGTRANELKKYAEENKKSKVFLLQPYTLKPNGEVFDEVRNFFIDGQWRYSVFTHGTDASDAGFYEEPRGPRKEATRELAERTLQEVFKQARWEGKRQTPLLVRIDIGVVPQKGADSLHKANNTYFVNEIEMTMCAWLDRYSPINVADVVAHAAIKHSLELLVGMLNAKKRRVPDAANVRKVVKILNDRLGPLKSVNLKS